MPLNFADYRVLSKLHESPRTLVVSAHRRSDGEPVVLKLPQPGQAGDDTEVRYANELRYRQQFGDGQITLERHLGLPLLVIHGSGGRSLREVLDSSGPLPLHTWLQVALATSNRLKAVHDQGLLHRDLHPGNLLWAATQQHIEIVDFELAVPLVRAQAETIARDQLEGALPYMAPEATGRMNVGLDERSDLYSLGVCLYELLVGERPFRSSDPLELVHEHMAAIPEAPQLCRSDVPASISAMIMKLLEKSPDQRYQSARGLEHDLHHALTEFERHGEVPSFKAGTHDVPDRYQPGTMLFGRDRDRAALLAALDQARAGECLLYTLGGYSGIGKTALVRQLREPALLSGSYYAEGKCDQYQRLQPYSAWAGALDQIVRQILARPHSDQQAARDAILQAVGDNGALLIQIVPTLETLIGAQPDMTELAAPEARNRLDYVFVAFMAQLTKLASPLVLFLDDLQWMDVASLDLLQAIVTSQEIGQLLVAGAYRDNEVDAAHPLRSAIKDLQTKVPERLHTVTLDNLAVGDLEAMIASNLNMEPGSARQLAQAVHEKTGGNPFFSHQLLKVLADARILHFDDSQDAWQWEPQRLAEMPLSDNVVDLLVRRLNELPESTQQLLQLGACIGNAFSPSQLAAVARTNIKTVEADLEAALSEGLLHRSEHDFRFGHDRIQQAAYGMISESAQPAWHLKIGRSLLGQSAQPHGRELFDVVAHFEKGLAELIDSAERSQVAALAADAARQASAASAHDVALRDYRFALHLLGDEAWQGDPDSHWSLYLEAMQSEFNNAHHDRVQQMIDVATAHVRTRLDRVALYELEIQFAIARNEQNAAIALALQALELLELNFAPTAEQLAEQAAELRKTIKLTPQDIADLDKLPEMQDPEMLAAMRVMVSAAGAAYVMRPDLWEVLTLRLVRTTLDHGSSPLAAFGYGFFGVLLAGVYQNIDTGYAFGQLSTRLLEHYGAEPLRAKIINLFDVFVRHWKAHLRESVDELPRGLQSGIDHGDFEYGSYNAIQHGKHRVICGYPLDEVLEQQQAYIQVIERLKMGYHLDFAHIWRQLAINLLGEAAEPHQLAGPDYDAEALIPRLLEQSSNFLVFNIHCTQTMLWYLLGDSERALQAADEAVKYAHYVPGMAELAEHNFFHSLTLLASLRTGDALHNRHQLRRVVRNQRQLDFWAQHAPMNFRHKWALVEAERLRRSAHPYRAAQLYEQAIQGAADSYYLNDQALAAELYGEYLLERGSDYLATQMLRESLRLYQAWKAHEKVRQLRQHHADLLSAQSVDETVTGTTSSINSINFDVQSALKASLAIANVTDVETLKNQLMRTIAESAGAERGILALQSETGWVVAARFGTDKAEPAPECALEDCQDIAQSVVGHVVAQGKSLALDDAAKAGGFEHDPVVKTEGLRSVLCVPMLHGNAVTGLLYLENRAAPRVFSPSSVKVIEILAAQASVAVEKARLLATLEQRVDTRTRDLSHAKRQLEGANASLAASEERFRLAMRGLSEGLFDWNLVTGELFLSPGWKHMLGYADDELDNTYETWRQLIDPAQQDDVLSAIEAQLNDGGESFEIEHRLQHQDGHWVQVVTRAHIVRNETGTAVRVVGSNVDVTAERQAQAVIEHQALHDTLTDLPNRALFTERLAAARKALRRDATPFALHMLDLDKFKLRNDTLGHLAGDEILLQVATRIQGLIRETDTAARLGGDEFAVIQAGVRDPADALALADKLIASISQPIEVDDGSTDVGCSIGIRLSDDPSLSDDVLLSEADAALYSSKNGGRGIASVYSSEFSAAESRSEQLLRELPQAMKAGQLHLEYQPELSLQDFRYTGVECLLRWKHPEFGLLTAAEFVPEAEHNGLADEVNEWVVRAAARRAVKWSQSETEFVRVSVNLAVARAFGPGFAQRVLSWLAAEDADADHFTFEFSTTLFALDAEMVRNEFATLQAAGSGVCLQGIGTEPIPLQAISQWQIKDLKLAPDLVRRIDTDKGARMTLQAIVAMARELGTRVTATGIETQTLQDIAGHSGCTAAQGYLVGKPAPGTPVASKGAFH